MILNIRKTLIVFYLLFILGCSSSPVYDSATTKDLVSIQQKAVDYLSRFSKTKSEELRVEDPVHINFFERAGFLVCIRSDVSVRSYEGPYGVFVTESGVYDTGGGSYLCENDMLRTIEGNEYTLIKAVAPENPLPQSTIVTQITVEFTIAEDGTVQNATVVGPLDVKSEFAVAAVSAAANIQHTPRIINGVTRKVDGVRIKYTFE